MSRRPTPSRGSFGRRALAALAGLALFAGGTFAADVDFDRDLKRADSIKIVNQAEFADLIAHLEQQQAQLSAEQKLYLRYLEGWHLAYRGEYPAALDSLRELIADSNNETLSFRARATIVNVLSIARRYEEALSELSKLLEALPNIHDIEAREQGLAVTARLYNLDGQYDLSLGYAQQLIDEKLPGSECRGGQMKLESLFRTGKLTAADPDIQIVIDACLRSGETLRANLIRSYVAELYIANHRLDDAIRLLNDHFEEVRAANYPNLIAEYNALLAQAHRESGNGALARAYALRAIDSAVKNEYTKHLVSAYRLLYLLAKEQGDTKAALAYHEKYTAADKAYLDDTTAKQLAYQRVKHEVDANKMQIQSLNNQNQVLQLQRQLSDKAMENIRLYILLLTVILVFIGLWAYMTKRSQLHFMKLSRRDGLTGIFNRPHFIELAESALKEARKNGFDVSVVLCDLDHFKSVNDKYGHAEGDYVLQRAVAAVQSRLRTNDVFARIGGEEFGILLPSCGLHEARQRAEQLRVAVMETNHGGKFTVSASFGIAAASISGHNLQLLMTHADAALYRAKRAGRNCVYGFDKQDSPEDERPAGHLPDGLTAQ